MSVMGWVGFIALVSVVYTCAVVVFRSLDD